MSDDEGHRSTEFFRDRPDGPLVASGSVPERKSPALAVGRRDSPRRTVVAYFRNEEAREMFEKTMRELITGYEGE